MAFGDTGEQVGFVALYLPLGSRGGVLTLLEAVTAPQAAEVHVAGDVIMQIHAPRDDSEGEDVERLRRLLGAWGTCPLSMGHATRRGHLSSASLDILAAPGAHAWLWTAATVAPRRLKPRPMLC